MSCPSAEGVSLEGKGRVVSAPKGEAPDTLLRTLLERPASTWVDGCLWGWMSQELIGVMSRTKIRDSRWLQALRDLHHPKHTSMGPPEVMAGAGLRDLCASLSHPTVACGSSVDLTPHGFNKFSSFLTLQRKMTPSPKKEILSLMSNWCIKDWA